MIEDERQPGAGGVRSQRDREPLCEGEAAEGQDAEAEQAAQHERQPHRAAVLGAERARQGELRIAVGVEHPPVGADRAFVRLPGLVERLDQVVVEAVLDCHRGEAAQEGGGVDPAGQGAVAHAAGARPADFADENVLASKRVDDLPANGTDMCSGPSGGNWKILPIGQDMDGDEIDGIGNVAVAQPEFPYIGVSDGHADARLDRADRPREVGCRHVTAQKHLVADDDGTDGFRVLVRERDGGLDLVVVFGWMAGKPQPLHDLQVVFGGNPGDLVQAEIDRVCTDAVGDFGEPGEVVVDLGRRDHCCRIKRRLQAAEWRV